MPPCASDGLAPLHAADSSERTIALKPCSCCSGGLSSLELSQKSIVRRHQFTLAFWRNFMSTQQAAAKQDRRHEEGQHRVQAKRTDMQHSVAGAALKHHRANEVDRMCERQQAGEVLK